MLLMGGGFSIAAQEHGDDNAVLQLPSDSQNILDSSSYNGYLEAFQGTLTEQSSLLDEFENTDFVSGLYIEDLVEFMERNEDILRRQSELIESFQQLVEDNWDDLTEDEQIALMESIQDLLIRQSDQLVVFELDLKRIWCSLSSSEKQNFLDSFQDLLMRESILLVKFEDVLHRKQTLEYEEQNNEESWFEFLSCFEDLVRRQSKLLASYEDMLKVDCRVLILEKHVDKPVVFPGNTVTYTYEVRNVGNVSLTNMQIWDSRLGPISGGFRLDPNESRSFSKSTSFQAIRAYTVCNVARVIGIDDKGFLFGDTSPLICVNITMPKLQSANILLGNQTAFAVYSGDPAEAINEFNVSLNQTLDKSEYGQTNREDIYGGDQSSRAFGYSSKASSKVNIVVR